MAAALAMWMGGIAAWGLHETIANGGAVRVNDSRLTTLEQTCIRKGVPHP